MLFLVLFQIEISSEIIEIIGKSFQSSKEHILKIDPNTPLGGSLGPLSHLLFVFISLRSNLSPSKIFISFQDYY